MKNQPRPDDARPHNDILNMTALENERKRQKEETLRWISDSALSRFRNAWGH